MGGIPVRNLKKGDAGKQRTMQAGNFITNREVKIYFTIPEFSATKLVTRNFHVDESTKSEYDIILGRDL